MKRGSDKSNGILSDSPEDKKFNSASCDKNKPQNVEKSIIVVDSFLEKDEKNVKATNKDISMKIEPIKVNSILTDSSEAEKSNSISHSKF